MGKPVIMNMQIVPGLYPAVLSWHEQFTLLVLLCKICKAQLQGGQTAHALNRLADAQSVQSMCSFYAPGEKFLDVETDNLY